MPTLEDLSLKELKDAGYLATDRVVEKLLPFAKKLRLRDNRLTEDQLAHQIEHQLAHQISEWARDASNPSRSPARPRPLSPAHIHQPPNHADGRTKRPTYLYTEGQLPYIYRLFYYKHERNFADDLYPRCAQLELHRLFHVHFYRHLEHVPTVPLHEVLVHRVIPELDKAFNGVVTVEEAFSVFGGSLNAVALCKAYDEHDLSVFVTTFTEEVQKMGSCATVLWCPPSPNFQPYFSERLRITPKESAMLAYLIISANNLGLGTGLFDIFESLKKIPEVVSASIVYGDAEIVACVETDGEEQMSTLIAEKIRMTTGVTGTKTYIGVHGYKYPSDEEHTER